MSTKKTLSCANCGNTFGKDMKEFNRQIRSGRSETGFFCSKSCSAKWGNKHATAETMIRKTAHLPQNQHKATVAAAKVNTKGRFTYYLRQARTRSKLKEAVWEQSDLNEQYLSDLWDKQMGKCAWTGIDMKLSTTADRNHGLYAASLDRIDSGQGYVQGNVQFVLAPLNMAKRNYPEQEFKTFLHTLGVSTLNRNRPDSLTTSPDVRTPCV